MAAPPADGVVHRGACPSGLLLVSCSMMTVTAITRLRGGLLLLATLLGTLGPACQLTPTARPAATPVAGDVYIRWLVERSMLHQAEVTARRYSVDGELWQHPFAIPQPRAASALASVRSEEHTSELQSRLHLVCRLLLEKKKR